MTSLGVQRLRLNASDAGGADFIPGWGAKIPHAEQPKNKIKIKNLLPLFQLFPLSSWYQHPWTTCFQEMLNVLVKYTLINLEKIKMQSEKMNGKKDPQEEIWMLRCDSRTQTTPTCNCTVCSTLGYFLFYSSMSYFN